MIDWKDKDLVCEFHVKQLIRDIKFLHNHNMYAVAQKKHLYIYDSNGIELHCMKEHLEPSYLEFLPYHFLLVSASKAGYLKYLDVSLGEQIAELKTKRGQPTCISQNPMNALITLGHSSGEITMWTPNTGSKPVVRVLAHPASSVTAMAVSGCGKYMVSTGKDARFKVWDIRNSYQSIYDYFTPMPVESAAFSDTGLVGLGMGNQVQVWKNTANEKQKAPYMKHSLPNKSQVCRVKFIPYEDVLAVSHDLGYSSIVVPGSGEPNFDAFEANPFETKKQRREAEVHNLLQKLQPDTISLKVNTIGLIDTASKEVKEKE